MNLKRATARSGGKQLGLPLLRGEGLGERPGGGEVPLRRIAEHQFVSPAFGIAGRVNGALPLTIGTLTGAPPSRL
jgi:hypothetical protein